MSRSVVWGVALIILIGAAVVSASKPHAPASARFHRSARGDGELTRCQALGEAAGADARCRSAWAAARAHFLGRAAP